MAEVATSPVEWRDVNGELRPFVGSQDVTWAPQAGSQEAFLSCPLYEAIYEGTRGPGKTDALLMDFAQDVGKGWGAEWRGVLFRQSYPQLSDVVNKSKKWFPRIWPAATFNEAKMLWRWPGGEELMFRHMGTPDDYYNYHGHAYPWIGWEELTTWPDDKCYKVMMSCSRSTTPGMPRKYRSTTNPYGVGHNWVKARFGLPVPPKSVVGRIVREIAPDGKPLPERVAIHGDLTENRILLHSDPGYVDRIKAAARNPSELAAWLYGSWDIVAGGMFDDLWRPSVHVIPNISIHAIPPRWRVDRAYDHGQSRPFSVGWYAESNGEPIRVGPFVIGHVPGDVIRIYEWYGWCNSANEGVRLPATEIARGILDRERDWQLNGRCRTGTADSAIFDDYEPGRSVAGDMKRVGVHWTAADKGPGSRAQGWQQIREFLKGALPTVGGTRERPGLFVCERCEQFLRTFPVLPRDDKNLDDVDTDSEDHIGDEVRYRLRGKRMEVKAGRWK